VVKKNQGDKATIKKQLKKVLQRKKEKEETPFHAQCGRRWGGKKKTKKTDVNVSDAWKRRGRGGGSGG